MRRRSAVPTSRRCCATRRAAPQQQQQTHPTMNRRQRGRAAAAAATTSPALTLTQGPLLGSLEDPHQRHPKQLACPWWNRSSSSSTTRKKHGGSRIRIPCVTCAGTRNSPTMPIWAWWCCNGRERSMCVLSPRLPCSCICLLLLCSYQRKDAQHTETKTNKERND
jgi:hypothetical protein